MGYSVIPYVRTQLNVGNTIEKGNYHLMSILNNMESLIKDPKIAPKGDVAKETENNLNNSIYELSKLVAKSIKDGDIKIEDTKDIKDIVSIYAMMKQGTVDSSSAPAVNTEMAKFYQVNFNMSDNPKENARKDIGNSLDKLDEKDVDDLIKKHADAVNARNLKSFGN